MANKKINNYINTRYNNWLDYAKYQSLRNKLNDAYELLNEVLCEILSSKSERDLENMIDAKNERGSQLDFFVLYMLKLNASSKTSRFRFKSKNENIDYGKDISRYDIEDEQYINDIDSLDKLQFIYNALQEIDVPDVYKQIFSFRFFECNNLNCWRGKYSLKHLYFIYNKVSLLIQVKVKEQLYFKEIQKL